MGAMEAGAFFKIAEQMAVFRNLTTPDVAAFDQAQAEVAGNLIADGVPEPRARELADLTRQATVRFAESLASVGRCGAELVKILNMSTEEIMELHEPE